MTVEHELSDQWLIVHAKVIEDVLRRAVDQRAPGAQAGWESDCHVAR